MGTFTYSDGGMGRWPPLLECFHVYSLNICLLHTYSGLSLELLIPRYIQAPSKCSTTVVYTIVHPIIAYAHDHDGGAACSAPARSCCEADIRR